MNSNVRKVIILSILYYLIDLGFDDYPLYNECAQADLRYKYADVYRALCNISDSLKITLEEITEGCTRVSLPVNRIVQLRIFEEIYNIFKVGRDDGEC